MARREYEWHFTYLDICRLTGKARNTVYQDVRRGILKMNSLGDVLLYCVRHGTEEFRRSILEVWISGHYLPGKPRPKRGRPSRNDSSKNAVKTLRNPI